LLLFVYVWNSSRKDFLASSLYVLTKCSFKTTDCTPLLRNFIFICLHLVTYIHTRVANSGRQYCNYCRPFSLNLVFKCNILHYCRHLGHMMRRGFWGSYVINSDLWREVLFLFFFQENIPWKFILSAKSYDYDILINVEIKSFNAKKF
jgi:hypothetical protein